MSIFYTKEKLAIAVNDLAVGIGGIRERLNEAYLSLHALTETSFPDRLKKDWNFIVDNLTKVGSIRNDKDEVIVGVIENTLRTLSDEMCVDIAQAICRLDSSLDYDE